MKAPTPVQDPTPPAPTAAPEVGTPGGVETPAEVAENRTPEKGAPAGTAEETTAAPAPRRRIVRRIAAGVLTSLAGLLVFVALVAPNQPSRFTPGQFARIPVEALLALALLLVLPGRARRVAAVLIGVGLGLLSILKFLDMGFYTAFDRQFDPLVDWMLLDDAVNFLTDAVGRAGAIGAVAAAVLLAVALPVLMVLALRRLARTVVRHRRVAGRAGLAFGAAWLVCVVLGVQIVPDLPVAAKSAGGLAVHRVLQVRAGLEDREKFAAETAADAFHDTPGSELLTALRGKDVIIAFVESYGRDAVEEPEFAGVGAVLDDGTRRLAAAGYGTRSAFLTSPTAGGGSWLAHATLLSGAWTDNQQRYRDLLATDRLTLNGAFRRAGWRTVTVMPALTAPWPEAGFFQNDRLYGAKDLGYRGPKFSFAPMPDQYTLAAFHRLERADPEHAPVMAEIPLISSHSPWTPLPRMVGWDELGNGSIFRPMAEAGPSKDEVYRDPARVRTQYGLSIEYSVSSLVSYVETYGDDDLVLIFLGDHQPAPVVTGEGASRDVPISIVTRDRETLDRIADWRWQDGLRPGAPAPVWRMDDFRDRFLTTFAR
ncbi:sulfatase [Plantactinospora sp. B5E13]|uniref:sulfatase n=1 Tax=unclassified Plantactinospora TaxID=2631981 RepID=UPI00325F3D95